MKKFKPETIDWSNYLKTNDVVCFSHLRWDFVYQRPQHIMSRFAKTHRVFFIEEPKFHDLEDTYSVKLSNENVWVVTPFLQENSSSKFSSITRQKILINKLFCN